MDEETINDIKMLSAAVQQKDIATMDAVLNRQRAKVAEAFGETSREFAKWATRTAMLYFQSDQCQKALDLGTIAHSIVLEIYGPEDLHVCAAAVNMGLFLCPMGRYDEAESKFVGALVQRVKQLGRDHYDVAHVYHNLGLLYRETKRTKKAIEYYNKALILWEKHRRINEWMATKRDIAELYSRLGQQAESTLHWEQLERFCEAAVGKDHPSFLNVLQERTASLDRAKTLPRVELSSLADP